MSSSGKTKQFARGWLENELGVEEELPPSVCWVLRELEQATGFSFEDEKAIRLAAACQQMDKKSDFVSSENERAVEEAILTAAYGLDNVVQLFHRISGLTGFGYHQLVQVYPVVLKKMIAKNIIVKDWDRGEYLLWYIKSR